MFFYEVNLLNVVFILFSFVIIVFGGLLSFIESRLPTFIRQTFRYGKHKYEGKSNPFIAQLEIPKAWFKHFYVFATWYSLGILAIVLRVYILQEPLPPFFINYLDFSCGAKRVATSE